MCERHVNSDFISPVFAQKRLVQSGLGRCHLAQVNIRAKAKSFAARSVQYGTCLLHVARDLTLAFCVGMDGPIGAGKTPFGSARMVSDQGTLTMRRPC